MVLIRFRHWGQPGTTTRFGRVVDVTGAADALVPAHRAGRAWRSMKLDTRRETALHPGLPQCCFSLRTKRTVHFSAIVLHTSTGTAK
jgi:hypothetical protein